MKSSSNWIFPNIMADRGLTHVRNLEAPDVGFHGRLWGTMTVCTVLRHSVRGAEVKNSVGAEMGLR